MREREDRVEGQKKNNMRIENLGYASAELRSQTTRFASTFHALMPPSAVPMSSFSQINNQMHIKCPLSNNQNIIL